MQVFEYKVVPSPRKGEKSRAARTTPDRFALALTNLMNKMGQEGWEYQRADALPCDERVGLTGTKTVFQNMLVFRRAVDAVAVQGLVDKPSVDQLVSRLNAIEPVTMSGAAPVLGAAEAPVGMAPAVGPANQGMAAE